MIDRKAFINTQSELEESLSFISKAFFLEKNFPDQVFRDHYTGFLAEGNGLVMGEALWEGLQKSALYQGEELITVVGLEQDGHVSKEKGYYNAFKLSIDAPKQEYETLMGIKPNKMLISKVIILVPESMNWAIWADADLELCIIGFNQEKGADKIPLNPDWYPFHNEWIPIETALDLIMANIFVGGKVPPEIAIPLCQHYGNPNINM